MRRTQQLVLVLLAITVGGMLIVGAGSAFAQDGNETTTTNRTPTEADVTPSMAIETTAIPEGEPTPEDPAQPDGNGSEGAVQTVTEDTNLTEDVEIGGNLTATVTPEEVPAAANETTIDGTDNNTVTETGPEASVLLPDQRSDGTTVYVESVTLPDGGFLAIHDNYSTPRNATIEVDGTPTEILTTDSVIGVSSYLNPGTHHNITIELFNVPGKEFEQTQLTQSREDMVATVHRDTNGNTAFEFTPANRTIDTPYRVPYLLSGETVRQQGPALGVGTVAVGESIEDVLGYDPNNVTVIADAGAVGENTSTEAAQDGSGAAGSGGGRDTAVTSETNTTEETENTTTGDSDQEAVTENVTVAEDMPIEENVPINGSETENSEGKAKQLNDGEDGTADGGNGKAKMNDGGNEEDTVAGGNGKAKAD